jgi:small subunit ribosomal protein S1
MKGVASEAGSDHNAMASLLDEYMESASFHRGDIVEGVIVSVNPRAILIDIGGKSDAAVHPREVERMSTKDLGAFKPGQSVNVYVVDSSDESGTTLVSLSRAAQQQDWDKARGLMKDEEPISLSVVDTNKGGVIVRLGRLRGFVPGSQLLPNWRALQQPGDPEDRWHALMGKSLNLRVIEVTPERNRLILSERKAADNKAIKRRILEELEIGSTVSGTVSNIVPFGAFVNINGVDGLLHISELSWKRVADPKEVVEIGEELEVYILDIDLDRGRLGLSRKKLLPDPWETLTDSFDNGQLVEADIVNLTSFGAFAALVEKPEIEGLIHISELSHQQVAHPREIVNVGERHLLKIISMRPRERRIAFSLKQVETETDAPASEAAEA